MVTGKYIKVGIIVILSLLLISAAKGQDTTAFETDGFRELITEIVERTENESVTEELANTIYDLSQNPVHINSAVREELETLFWLKTYQIDQLIAYITRNGALKSIYELGYIEGFSEDDVQLLRHFISLEGSAPVDSSTLYRKKTLKQQILIRSQRTIQKQYGYRDKESYTSSNHYLGNPWKYYLKYSIKSDNVVAGLTCEKDAGEEFFTGSNKNGFDFYSFHLMADNYKFIKRVVIGDYSLQFGQGLIVNSRYSFGKSLSVFNSTTSGAGINRYTSADENNFFRGIAATLNWKYIDVSLFYSRHKIDANVSLPDSLEENALAVSSLQNAGIHGTPGEIADEKTTKMMVTGSHVRYLRGNLELGATAMLTTLSSSLVPEADLYNIYNFKGTQNSNFGINYRWRLQNILFFGEEAISENKGIAFLNGMQYNAGNRLGLRIVHRHYEKDYQSLFSNAFGENSRNQNEDGLFVGIECSPLKRIVLAGYADFFKFPWLRYNADMPSSGREYMIQLTYKPNQQFNCYVQYRNKKKEENLSGTEENKNVITPVITDRVRLNASYKINESWYMQNRIGLNSYNKVSSGKSFGVYISQDLAYSFSRLPVKLYLRYAIFDTRDFNSCIYAYENDLLYTFSVPMFYDKGSRSYAMVKVSPLKYIDLWLKYSVTRYAEKTSISSNLSMIEGNTKSEIRMQMLVKF